MFAELQSAAFSACFEFGKNEIPGTTGLALIFSNVITNYGGAYNPANGYFTAPIQGLYYFTFHSYTASATSVCIYNCTCVY